MSRMPDFVIIGAMKCATTTLHDQLAAQPGLYMSEPKEPFFFSNDEVYARGIDWYAGLFAGAADGDLCGESSTHYTKLPTYPRTIERMLAHFDPRRVRLIYVMRHPIDRLISHYIHEWTERTVPEPIERAVRECPRLVEYSQYAMQLLPFREAFGPKNILPVFFEQLIAEPQAELERVCKFIGYAGAPRWRADDGESNVSAKRLRKSRLRDALVWNPVSTWIRRRMIPQRWRDRVKQLWQMRERPKLSEATLAELRATFDEDLRVLGGWLGVEMNCSNFKAVAKAGPLEFADGLERVCSAPPPWAT